MLKLDMLLADSCTALILVLQGVRYYHAVFFDGQVAFKMHCNLIFSSFYLPEISQNITWLKSKGFIQLLMCYVKRNVGILGPPPKQINMSLP
jgi:hypothetical protein